MMVCLLHTVILIPERRGQREFIRGSPQWKDSTLPSTEHSGQQASEKSCVLIFVIVERRHAFNDNNDNNRRLSLIPSISAISLNIHM